MSSKLENSAQT